MARTFYAKRRARRNLLGPKATSAALIQALARGRHDRRVFRYKMRRRRRQAAIVLQKHLRAFAARKRVFHLRENMKQQVVRGKTYQTGYDTSWVQTIAVMVWRRTHQQQQYQQQQSQYDEQYQQYPQSQQYNNDHNTTTIIQDNNAAAKR